MARRKTYTPDAAPTEEPESPAVEEPQDPTPSGKISGDDLKAQLRQQRREARLKEKGY